MSAIPPSPRPHALSEEELSAIYRAKLMFRVLVVAGAAFLAGLGLVIASGVWLIRGTQVHNTQIGEDTHHSAQLIESCVTPGGACYERSQRQTGAAVDTLNTYILLSASCAAHIATATNGLAGISKTELTKLLTACVRSQLAMRHR